MRHVTCKDNVTRMQFSSYNIDIVLQFIIYKLDIGNLTTMLEPSLWVVSTCFKVKLQNKAILYYYLFPLISDSPPNKPNIYWNINKWNYDIVFTNIAPIKRNFKASGVVKLLLYKLGKIDVMNKLKREYKFNNATIEWLQNQIKIIYPFDFTSCE